MTKQEARDLVYAGLKKSLKDPDFRLNQKEGAFARRIPIGFQKVYVPFYDYKPMFVFSLTVGIRLDAVEDIFNRFSGANSAGQKLTLTTITRLSHFTGHLEEYKVSAPAEIATALTDLGTVIQAKIMPFLDNYQDVRSLDTAMNTNKVPGFDSSNLLMHAMHSVILARLNGSSLYRRLVDEYEKSLRNYVAAEKERFNQLVRSLDEMSV